MKTLRLRQAVVAASDRAAVADAWHRELGTGTPFHDPGVGEFGLCNAVLPVGDTFLEVVSPVVAGSGSAAGRFMARNGGDCGYMAIFQVEDIESARAHLSACGLRTIWTSDHREIRATHVHPADIGGAIVSFDQPMPPESWQWAGPGWSEQKRTGVVTGLAGITLAAANPGVMLGRWSDVLAVEAERNVLTLPDSTTVRVVPPGDGRTGIVGIDLWAADGVAPRSFDVAGVTFGIVARES